MVQLAAVWLLQLGVRSLPGPPRTPAAPVRPAFGYSWDKLSTYAFPGHIMGGNLTADEVQHFSRFSLLLYWGIDLRKDPTQGSGWFVPDQEARSIAQAAALKAANPDIKLFPYITGFMAQTWFAAQAEFDQPEHAAWWLKDPVTGVAIDCNSSSPSAKGNVCMGYSQGAPGRLYDWRIPEVRDYFTQKVIAPYVDCENISGIFMDDTTDVAQRCMHPPHGMSPCTGSWTFSENDQLDFVNATMQHLEQALSSMDAKGKTAIVSTEVSKDSAPLNASVFDAMLLQHGALHYNEFFTGTEEDVQTALKLVAKGTPFMVHSAGPNTIGPFAAREYCLAAFLIVMGEYSYWGMGSGWSTDSFPWYPEYDRPLGKALGIAEPRGPGKYFRAFEHLNVSLDTTKKTAKILWHDLGPVPTPPPPPPPSPPPPATPIGAFTSVKAQTVIHQNPPSYSDDKTIVCSNQTFMGCAAEAATACNALAGCASFSVISKLFQGKVWAELGPMPLTAGVANKWWSTWAKAEPTAGKWKPVAQPLVTPA